MTAHHPQWVVSEGIRINCRDCIAECCKHIAIPIDKPEDWEDYQFFAEYLQHEETMIYQDAEKDWLIEIRTRCENLLGDKRCKAWNTEQYPMTCSEYEVENCVMNAPDDYWEVLLESPEQVAEYAKRKGIKKPIRTVKRRNCRTECCNHLAVPADEPEDWRDFNDFKWYIFHKDVIVYQDEDGDWFVEVKLPTRKRCEKCDRQGCKYDEPDHPVVFRTPEDIDAYCEEQGIRKPVQKTKKLTLSPY